jgi:hypothetical protein
VSGALPRGRCFRLLLGNGRDEEHLWEFLERQGFRPGLLANLWRNGIVGLLDQFLVRALRFATDGRELYIQLQKCSGRFGQDKQVSETLRILD